MKTKTSKITRYVYLLGVVLLLFQTAYSQEEFKREYSKNYSCSNQTIFNLSNKYGNIEIKDWEKNEIDITAKIVVRDISKQKADQAFELVNIKFSQQGNEIEVITDYDDAFFRIVKKNLGNENRFEVNYIISMPSYVLSHIKNKYGSVFISKLVSASSIDVQYGSLKVNQLDGSGKDQMVKIDLGYSTGSIESCKWLKINCKYSKLNIDDSKALIILSKYSKLHIEKGSSIVSESKYDEFTIGYLANFVTEAEYSNFKIMEITKKIQFDNNYTDFKVEKVPAGFELIEINNKYGSVKIGIDSGVSYKLMGYARYAKINYPSNSRINRLQENTKLQVNGIVGEESENLPEVSIQTSYGGVSLVY